MAKTYNVLGVAYKQIRKISDEAKGADGECNFTDKTIGICPDADDVLTVELHELIHAKDFESGLYQVFDRTMLEVNAETTARVILANYNLSPKKKK